MMVTGKDGLCSLLLCILIHCNSTNYNFFIYVLIFVHFAIVMEEIREIPFTLKEVDFSEMLAS
jgi:hypothetical protein